MPCEALRPELEEEPLRPASPVFLHYEALSDTADATMITCALSLLAARERGCSGCSGGSGGSGGSSGSGGSGADAVDPSTLSVELLLDGACCSACPGHVDSAALEDSDSGGGGGAFARM